MNKLVGKPYILSAELSELDRKWRSMVLRLIGYVNEFSVSVADAYLVEIWNFLAENKSYIDPEWHKRICDDLNKLCELIWSEEYLAQRFVKKKLDGARNSGIIFARNCLIPSAMRQ